jgi:lipid-A-disaccharide synthase
MTFLIVAGDPSGDMRAAELAIALQARRPGLKIVAVGGGRLKEVADEFLEDLAGRGIVGFWEPLRHLPFLRGLLNRLDARLAASPVDGVVVVDYYGFNRRVLELAGRRGIPAYYYVCPQVWASRAGRLLVLKKLVRKALVIFPFEEKLYREAGLPAVFVGHPLAESLPAPRPRRRGEALRVGLLPGSRGAELRRHLALFLAAFRILRREFPEARGIVIASRHLPPGAYAAVEGVEGASVEQDSDYGVRSGLDVALTASGTATLENALLGIPMVVVYRMSWPTYWAARTLIRVPYIAMANILAGRRLVPELIQSDATPERIAEEAAAFLRDRSGNEALRSSLAALRSQLGGPGAAVRAAAEILRDYR